ncbi:hypothetical protein J4H03_25800, partial [Enterobacter hormaechei]|uniref:hypothetical protein n=1 Tax=Enterobacter hormaechei TaxID=158836 RepID=UPI001A9E378D|nr:hypothetical protein [Enterobacter hormaechei]
PASVNWLRKGATVRLLSQTAEPAQRMMQTLAQTSVWEHLQQRTRENGMTMYWHQVHLVSVQKIFL